MNLTMIHAFGTQISNLSPLSGLINLSTVRIDLTKITDLKPLETLTQI